MSAKCDAIQADKDIKHCFRCNRCWEIDKMTTRNQKGRRENSILSYYENFPSYGKQKKTCKDCKVEQMSQGMKGWNYENTKTN